MGHEIQDSPSYSLTAGSDYCVQIKVTARCPSIQRRFAVQETGECEWATWRGGNFESSILSLPASGCRKLRERIDELGGLFRFLRVADEAGVDWEEFETYPRRTLIFHAGGEEVGLWVPNDAFFFKYQIPVPHSYFRQVFNDCWNCVPAPHP